MEYFRNMGVYTKVSKKRCHDVTGKAPIGVRWVDINKQDDASPLYRSRLVAKDFNKGKDPDLYTATPPLELLRVLVSLAAGRKRKRRWTMEAYGERREPRVLLCAKPQAHVRRNLSRRLRAWR